MAAYMRRIAIGVTTTPCPKATLAVLIAGHLSGFIPTEPRCSPGSSIPVLSRQPNRLM